MPKVGGHKPIFQLYLPKPRLQAFPKADWRFLIHAASNTARAFTTVHSTGLVIGDVNHGNLVVAEDATVQMIDCDSFQVSSGGQTWFCTVGVGTHQPPEMQGRDSYAGIVRTPNHDNFGLAVIIFQLLCMARHPFAGRFQGAGEPPSIEDAIAASRYAYSRDRSRTKMDVPPGSLPIGALPPELRELFEDAFAPGASRGGRPAADRWISALGGLAADVKPCRVNRSHYYRKGANACPWCAIEGASGITLFPVVFVPGAAGAGGMAALWQEVGRVADPPPLGSWPPAPTPSATLSPDALAAANSGKGLRLAAWASVAAAVASALLVASPDARALLVPAIGVLTFLIFRHTRTQHPGPFRRRLIDVKQDWEALRSSWATPVAGQGLPELRTGLSKLKAEYDNLPNERAKRLQRLDEQRRDKQLEEYLDRFPLAGAKIPGIGPTRVATLSSYGIDTAGDIVSATVLAVPGFGPTTVNKLVAWRRGQEASFRFDPSRGVSPSDVAVVERDIAAHRTKLEREVATGLARLKAVASSVAMRRQALHGKLAELGPRYAQALADVAAVPEGRQTHLRLLTMSGLAIVAALFSAVGAPSRSPTSRLPPAAALVPSQAASSMASPLPVPEPERKTETSPATGQQTAAAKPPATPAAATTARPVFGVVTVKQATDARTEPRTPSPADLMAELYRSFPKSLGASSGDACSGSTCEPRLVAVDAWTGKDGVERRMVVGAAETKDCGHACSAIMGIGSFRLEAGLWRTVSATPAVTRFGAWGVFQGKVAFLDGGVMGRVVMTEESDVHQGVVDGVASIVVAVDGNYRSSIVIPTSHNLGGYCDIKEADCRKRAAEENYESKISVQPADDGTLRIAQTFISAIQIPPATWVVDKTGTVRQTGGGKASPGGSAQERAQVEAPASTAFDQGRADRVQYEAWFNGLQGDARAGAESWVGRRSLRAPGSCAPPPGQPAQWSVGCTAAREKLSPLDSRRKADPDYRHGWNSL